MPHCHQVATKELTDGYRSEYEWRCLMAAVKRRLRRNNCQRNYHVNWYPDEHSFTAIRNTLIYTVEHFDYQGVVNVFIQDTLHTREWVSKIMKFLTNAIMCHQDGSILGREDRCVGSHLHIDLLVLCTVSSKTPELGSQGGFADNE
jgi:hypothetical protein